MRTTLNIVILMIIQISLMGKVWASVTKLSVTLPSISITLKYAEPVRLSQILFDSQKILHQKSASPTFWLAAQLLQKSKNNELDVLKKEVLEKLDFIIKNNPGSQVKAQSLSEFIKNSHFNYRHFISLDNDFIRITKENDPLLNGDFTLLTPARKNKLQIIGASPTSMVVNFIENGTIDDYLQDKVIPGNSDSSIFYVIQPDANVSKVNTAMWHKDPIFFAPEAILFIGFKRLPNDFFQLNNQIAELLRSLSPLSEKGSI